MLAGAMGLVAMALVYVLACHRIGSNLKPEVKVVLDWNQFMLYAETNTEGYRGPVASRTYAYIGLAAYEAALPGLNGDFISFAEKFPELKLPARPPEAKFDPAIALNACYSAMMHSFFLSAADPVDKELNRRKLFWETQLNKGKEREVIDISTSFGHEVALAVFAWSATDSLGFRANHHNYSRSYIPPTGEADWVTSIDFPMPALLPYWGGVRPFIIRPEQYQAKPLPPFSTEKNSAYYIQAVELISLSKSQSSENQWIAEFWNDDHPGLTFSPPGHWLAITNQVIEMENPALEKALETYLKVGFAMADGMIATWKSKYQYNLLRPETYIQRYIDSTWRPLSPTPSFPSYPSGHSTMGAAAAEILTSLYGDNYRLLDKSHEANKEVTLKPRQFDSFYGMAREAALSRILLGVHWRMDSEEGLRLGEQIGKEVASIKLERKPDQ